MLHYCVFKGVDSRTLGLKLGKCPPKVSPKQRITEVTIPGRHGTLTQTDGTYEPFTREAEFVFHSLDRADQIMALFKGSGLLIFDDEPDKTYQARVIDEVSAEWVMAGWRKITVSFECQPFAREHFPQSIAFSGAVSVHNIGTVEAYPTITLYGSGDLTVTVNGSNFTIKGVTSSAKIDCENMVAFEGTNLLTTVGDYPVLPLGESTISSAAEKVVMTPNWRWL